MAKDTRNAAAAAKDFNPSAAPGQKLPDFSNWTKEQIGFAPYWTPEEGKWFLGVMTDKDLRDPNFIRLQFQALAVTPCQRGPNDAQNERHEKVIVDVNDHFSMSVYAGIKELFEEYEGMPFPVPVRVTALRKSKTKEGQDFWNFEVIVSPETRKILNAHRAEAKKLKAAETQRARLEE